MKESIRFSVPHPCSANWDQMTKIEQGRFCQLCQKTVVDFTSMSQQEIFEFISKTKDAGTCGRFYQFQLQPSYSPLQKKVIRMYHYAEMNIKNRLLRIAALFAISLAMTITGCHQNSSTTGKALRTNTDSMPATVDSMAIDTSNKILTGLPTSSEADTAVQKVITYTTASYTVGFVVPIISDSSIDELPEESHSSIESGNNSSSNAAMPKKMEESLNLNEGEIIQQMEIEK